MFRVHGPAKKLDQDQLKNYVEANSFLPAVKLFTVWVAN